MLLLFVGDTHGDLHDVERVIYSASELGAHEIVQLGDWGFLWPGRDDLDNLEHILSDAGVHMRFIDGNHDDHPRLRGYSKSGARGGIELTEHVTYQPRGSIHAYEDGTRVGFLGGAISIDKKHRTEGRSWWPQEEVTEEESHLFDGVEPVDILCTHDSPIIPAGLSSLSPKLTEDCDRHRALIARALEASGARLLLHGHYHIRYTARYGTKSHVCQVEGLAHGYSRLEEFTLLVDTENFRRS